MKKKLLDSSGLSITVSLGIFYNCGGHRSLGSFLGHAKKQAMKVGADFQDVGHMQCLRRPKVRSRVQMRSFGASGIL